MDYSEDIVEVTDTLDGLFEEVLSVSFFNFVFGDKVEEIFSIYTF
jgi:hypothetical protein